MRYTVSPDAACATVDDGAVVLHMRSRRYYSLNPTGAAIWSLLEQGAPVPGIVASLVETYDVDAPAAERAVLVLMTELAEVELVTLEGR